MLAERMLTNKEHTYMLSKDPATISKIDETPLSLV